MKYGELIQFDPIESVVQLRKADNTSEANILLYKQLIFELIIALITTMISSIINHKCCPIINWTTQ